MGIANRCSLGLSVFGGLRNGQIREKRTGARLRLECMYRRFAGRSLMWRPVGGRCGFAYLDCSKVKLFSDTTNERQCPYVRAAVGSRRRRARSRTAS